MKSTNLHQLTQEIITAIANKQPILAKKNIEKTQSIIEQLMDETSNNDELIELSKYQSLVTLLNNKLK